jgi:uncharacterized protein YbaR (Trm112 family)
MTPRALEYLRCIWMTNPRHPADATLELLGNEEDGILRCKGCRELYLITGGTPVLLSVVELSKPERRLLKERRKQLGIL